MTAVVDDEPGTATTNGVNAPAEPNRAHRRAAAKTEKKAKAATLAQLRKKKVRKDQVELPQYNDDGSKADPLIVRMQAIGSVVYDKMISEHPPTREQEARSEQYNIHTFAPALISACAVEPLMTVEDAVELYESDEWSGGEIGALFWCAQRLNNAGIDIPFTGSV